MAKKKFSGVLDKWCPVGTVILDAGYTLLLTDGTRKCSSCGRKGVRLLKGGTVARHVFQLADTRESVKPHENSVNARGMKAWTERGRQR